MIKIRAMGCISTLYILLAILYSVSLNELKWMKN